MESLESLSIKYDVDTLELGYIPHYENLFSNIRNDVTKVLEIGVETGRSHRMWLEYFPNATIYGFDIFEFGVEEFHRLQEGNPNLDRSVMFKGDQSNVQDIIENFKIEVFFTPGHTQGSVCLLIDGCLFTGDTLLNEKIGRTDLPGGNKQVLKESLKIISKMPSHISIYPGHGSSSTIGYELKNNSSFIQALQ